MLLHLLTSRSAAAIVSVSSASAVVILVPHTAVGEVPGEDGQLIVVFPLLVSESSGDCKQHGASSSEADASGGRSAAAVVRVLPLRGEVPGEDMRQNVAVLSLLRESSGDCKQHGWSSSETDALQGRAGGKWGPRMRYFDCFFL